MPARAASKPARPVAAKPPAAPAAPLRIDIPRARAHWHRKSGLGATPARGASVDAVVSATGWPRTLGGIDVYLAVRARVPGMKRRDLDAAVETARLKVVPAVRGCIYLVPQADVPVVLRIAEEQYRKRADREHQKAGLDASEIAEVASAVLSVLKKGGAGTDAIRKALPEGTLRSLGDRGKKVGISSALPPALRHLEFEGKVERTLEEGRLDSERYVWRVPKKNPFAGAKIPPAGAERHAVVLRAFVGFAGPTRLVDFCDWAALSQKEAHAAAERLPLAPVMVDGWSEEALVLESDLPALRDKPAPAAAVSFLAFEDNYLVLHGGPALFTDPRHHGRSIASWGTTTPTTIAQARHLSSRAILDGDRLAGFWEFDPDARRVVTALFDAPSPARKKVIDAAADDVAAFIRDDLGHGKSFSLDTEDAVRRRAAAIRAMT